MSSISCIRITGIRSFSPTEPQTLEFFSPLTVIVGPNGAGKTTVIECLRYATTGQFPPNTERRAFVHDPKIAHEREVRAQVMLRFQDLHGKIVTITRVNSVTMTPRGVGSFKTLDSTMHRRNRDGNDVSLSQRCADVDAEMSHRLGVSKAILNDVIFCHQEDSLWPLSEPAELKRRFDDIFASTRYIKALDELKKLRKVQSDEAKLQRGVLEEKSKNRQLLESLREKQQNTALNIAKAERELEQLRAQLDQKEAEYRVVNLAVLEQGKVSRDLELLVIRIEDMRRETDQLRDSFVTEYQESDQVLRDIMNQHRENLANKERDVGELQARKARADEEGLVVQKQLDSLVREQVQLQSAAEKQVGAKESLDAFAQQIEARHHIPGTRFAASGQYNELLALLSNAADTSSRDLAKAKDEGRREQEAVDKEIMTLSGELSRLRERQRSDQQKLDSEQAQLAAAERELATLSSGSQTTKATKEMDRLRTSIAKLNSQLATVRSSLEAAEYDNFLVKARAERKVLDDEMTALVARERADAQFAQQRTLIAQQKTDLEARRKALADTMQEKRDLLWELLEDEPTAATLMQDTIVAIDELDRRHKHHQREVDKVSNMLLITNKDIAALRNEIAAKGARKISLEETIRRHPDLASLSTSTALPTLLADLRSNHEAALATLSLYRACTDIYQRFRHTATSSHKCHVCERGYEGGEQNADLGAFVSRLEGDISRFSENQQTEERRLETLQTQLAAMQTVLPQWEEYQALGADLADKEAQLEELVNTQQEQEQTHEQLNELLTTVSNKLEAGRKCNGVVMEIHAMHSNVQKLAEEIATKERALPAAPDSSIQDQIAECDKKIKQHRLRAASRETEQRSLESRRSEIQDQLHTLQSEQRALEDAQRRRTDLATKRDSLQLSISALTASMASYEARLGELPGLVAAQNTNKQALLKEADARESRVLAEQQALASSVSELRRLVAQLTELLAMNAPVRLGEVSRKISECESRRAQLRADSAELDDALRLGDQDKIALENVQRSVDDTLRYRAKLREIDSENARREQLEAQITAADVPAQRRRLGQLETDLRQIRSEVDRTDGRRSQLLVEQRDDEARLEPYANADEEYRKQLIKMTTCDVAAEDLEKYMRAVTKAIMHFHSLKMTEINKTIRELWASVYQGMDIDGIEIRSEDESKEGAKSYKYRVVMIKGDVELDMRGRCSAGQKVIASIIIRLALAETFGVNCGILALDEPTTNLDQANVDRLAEALQAIIHERRNQRNFQLIVITHDEHFVDLLGRSENASHFWRVSKNLAQHSVVEKVAFTD